MAETGKVYFVGAGPGDPELITVKGLRTLARAEVVVQAGSLVNPELLAHAASNARIYDSAGMSLEEIMAVIVEAARRGQNIARLHSGDPSLYGALQEQIRWLEREGIPYEIIPGVSSMAAAAAAIRRELTLPGVSQTVIITRYPGRTPVPATERLASLAQHRTSMCIFLSAHAMDEVAAELGRAYPPETPVAVVYRASWPDERVVQGRLGDIAGLVAGANIRRSALILVGDFLTADFTSSLLYRRDSSHGFRQARRENLDP